MMTTTTSQDTSSPSKIDWRVIVAFAAIYTIWGSTYLGIRIAIESLPPLLMAGTRFVIAGPLLYAWSRCRGAARPTPKQWLATAIVGGALILGGNGLVTLAEQRVASGLAALLVATVPLWLVVLDWLFLKGEKPTITVVLGLVLGLVGIGLLVGPGDLLGDERVDLVGVGLVLLAAFSWASGSLYSRRAAMPDNILLSTGMQMITGGMLMLLVAGLRGEWGQVDLAAVTLRSWLALAYLTVFGSIVAYTAYTWLLRHVKPAWVGTYAYVNPVVAVFLGWAFAGEDLSVRMLIAAVIIVLAVVVITTSRSSK